MRLLLLSPALLVGLLGACAGDNPAGNPATQGATSTPDMHNSQNSLNWGGVYEGLLACADCPGTHTRLTLGQDGSFELFSRSLVRGAVAANAKGQFTWQPDGNSVALDDTAGAKRFAVGEGRVILLNSDGSRPDAASASLIQLPTVQGEARTGLSEVLEDHRWTLTSATGSGNQRIDSLFPSAERNFVFGFAGSRVNVEGGCNGLRGGYQVSADGQLTVGRLAATMMACDAPLMAADSALSALLAAPLETVLVQGPQPTLALLAEAGEVMLLAGEMTPEARYGPGSTVFLEVGPQRVACGNATSADGLCLQVREIGFDEQGLRVGTPGEFQPFAAPIEGFTHVPGNRNVLRVKRFQPAGTPGDTAALYILDLVVESETVSQ